MNVAMNASSWLNKGESEQQASLVFTNKATVR